MTASELVRRLQEEIAERPEAGAEQVLISRDNGKRTNLSHRITSLGWRKLTDYNPNGHVSVCLDFDGSKY